MSSSGWDEMLDHAVAAEVARRNGWQIPSAIDGIGLLELFRLSSEHHERVQRWIEEHRDEAEEIRRGVVEQVVAEHERRVEERLAEWLDGLAEREAEDLWRFLLAVGVGELTADVVCGSVDDTEPLRISREWVRSGERGTLLLLGSKGTGKTVAAAWAMAEAASTTSEVCLCDACHRYAEVRPECLVGPDHRARVQSLIRWTRRAFFVKAGHLASALHRPNGDEMWQRARQAFVLVIDDLGREYADQHGRWHAEMDLLIDDRHEARRPTIITANLTPAEFKERYGERIADRIRQCGRVVTCAGESLRSRRHA